jgi:hypothetical protein
MTVLRKILYPFEEVTYLTLLVLAILACNSQGAEAGSWSPSQARIICVGTVSAIIGIWAPLIIEKAFEVRLTGLVDILLALDIFLAIVFGECLRFYYKIPNYDKFLHFLGTSQLAIAGYALSKFLLQVTNKGKHQRAFALVFGFFFAMGTEALWELYEFTVDTLGGTDMQKYIPDAFEGCIDSQTLEYTCSDQQIADYYKTWIGHHYALVDTMNDIISDVCGALLGTLGCAVVFRFKPQLQDSLIMKNPSNKDEDDSLPVIPPEESHHHSNPNTK